MTTLPIRPRPLVRVMVLLVSLTLMSGGVGLVEAWLRYDGRFASYYEYNKLPDPGHTTERLPEPYLHIYGRNARWDLRKAEFTMEIQTNREGLVGPDTPVEKAPGEFRIITIGDSFTEGVGAKVTESYPADLERLLAGGSGPRTYSVMNAGISGSDPVYGIELLRRKLLPYKADLVILAMNNSDVDDLKRLGGFDRYGPDGQPRGRPLPWWTPIFDRSHLARAMVLGVLHYDWDLRSPSEIEAATQQSIKGLIQSGVLAAQLGADHGFRFLVVIHPTWWQVEAGENVPELGAVARGLQEAGVDHADLLPFFKTAIPRPVPPDYYWPKDLHYTAKGYEVFARAVYAELEKRGVVTP